jgi:hypothetical protein
MAQFQEKAKNREKLAEKISELTLAFSRARDLLTIEKIIVEHENLIAEAVNLPRAKTLFFDNFWGEIKSLGAWGGDFVMATSDRSSSETRRFFEEKGFPTVFKYDEMVK